MRALYRVCVESVMPLLSSIWFYLLFDFSLVLFFPVFLDDDDDDNAHAPWKFVEIYAYIAAGAHKGGW